jgi:hypothetical protein
MHVCIARLVGISPYSQSKNIDLEEHPKKPGEIPDDYEKRTAVFRKHVNGKGNIEIPQTAITNAVKEGAKRLALPIKGKRMQTYTKNFEAGVMMLESLDTGIKAEDVPLERLFLSSDGRPGGGGKRVWRYYPRIDAWDGDATFTIFDDVITEDVFLQVLASAGSLVGIGRFRPQNRGFYGRFKVASHKWFEDGAAAFGKVA